MNEGRNFPSFSSQMEENILTQNGERLREGRRVCSFASAPYDESNHESRRQTDGAGQGRAGQGRAEQKESLVSLPLSTMNRYHS